MRVVLDGVRPWRHDLAGCLHACAATLFAARGIDPLDALGAAWWFRYRPGDVRREEYYMPCREGASLLEAIAPYQAAISRWREPIDAEAGWAEVRDEIVQGRPVVVAVDNFHLPFRPAHRDVHSNHLLVVHGFDEGQGTARVLDAVPPRFDGDIPLEVLRQARGSINPAERERDLFFAASPIAHRWLEVTIARSHVGPAEAVRRNLAGFAAAPDGPTQEGLAGQARFLASMIDRHETGEDVVDELFVVAGAVLATTGLHARWLAQLADRLPAGADLRELARRVDRIAHHWTALRIAIATARGIPARAAGLRRRARALHADHEWLLGDLAGVIDQLPDEPRGEKR